MKTVELTFKVNGVAVATTIGRLKSRAVDGSGEYVVDGNTVKVKASFNETDLIEMLFDNMDI